MANRSPYALRPNAIGLRRLGERHRVRDTWAAYRTLTTAMCLPTTLHVYQIKHEQVFGNRQLSYPGIARIHFFVESVSMNADDPVATLLVRNCPYVHVRMRVYHHNLEPGAVAEEMNQDAFDMTIAPITLQEGNSCEVHIGDTVQLYSGWEDHPRFSHRGTFFTVVGLSIADESTIAEMSRSTFGNDDRVMTELRILPHIHKWHERRCSVAAYQIRGQHVTGDETNMQWQEANMNNLRNDVVMRKLGTLFELFKRSPTTFEFAHRDSLTLEDRILSRVDFFFDNADSAATSVNDIVDQLVQEFDKSINAFRFRAVVRKRLIVLMNKKRMAIRQDRLACVVTMARQNYFEEILERNSVPPAIPAGPPLVPLQNPGNLCYMNVVVQLLVRMRCIREIFLGVFWDRFDVSAPSRLIDFGRRGGFVAVALRQLFRDVASATGPQSAANFKEAMVYMREFRHFDNEDQHDANEFLLLLLQVLSCVLVNESWNPISDYFSSRMRTTIRCQTPGCNHQSSNDLDISSSLAIDIVGDSLEDCFARYFGDSPIDAGWTCANCNSREQRPLHGYSLSPRPILIITLKRFRRINGRQVKIQDMVRFPTNRLDTTMYMTDTTGQTFYKLAAVINHQGSEIAKGHYVLLARGVDETWVRYDDENVENVTEVMTRDAYTLIYCLEDWYGIIFG